MPRADSQPASSKRAEAEQARELFDALAEVDELSARGHADPLAIRQGDRWSSRAQRHRLSVTRHESLAQHAPPLVVADERELREAIDLRERLAERAERRLHVGGNGERVGERGERARRHRVRSWVATSGQQRTRDEHAPTTARRVVRCVERWRVRK